MRTRGLRDSTIIEHFRLGFCNRTLAFRIPEKNRKAGAAIRGVLADAGLLKFTGREYFRRSVGFPIMDGERPKNHSERTVQNRRQYLGYFIAWAANRRRAAGESHRSRILYQ